MSKRCQTCWNVLDCCSCPISPPEGICVPHSDWEPTNTRYWHRDHYACICGPVPLFSCEHCKRFNVPKKSPGVGYWCDDCMGECWDQFQSCPYKAAS